MRHGHTKAQHLLEAMAINPVHALRLSALSSKPWLRATLKTFVTSSSIRLMPFTATGAPSES